MDITTLLGLVAGAIVLSTLILMGGDFRMFYDIHAVIIIFGGSIGGDTDPLSRSARSCTACRWVQNSPSR